MKPIHARSGLLRFLTVFTAGADSWALKNQLVATLAFGLRLAIMILRNPRQSHETTRDIYVIHRGGNSTGTLD